MNINFFRCYCTQLLLVFVLLSFACSKVLADDKVTLNFASWRLEDSKAMNRILAIYHQKHPGVTVTFCPVIFGTEYDAKLLSSLANGSGPDIMFLRSFTQGRTVYDRGFLARLNGVSPNLEAFPAVAKRPWSTESGDIYGVPAFAVAHGVYYSVNIFEQYGIKVPEDWADFIHACQLLKKNGEIAIAQGTEDKWTLYEVVFSGLGPNFYGGEASRKMLMEGKIKFTAPPFIEAFKRIKQLQPFFPKNYKKLKPHDIRQMFIEGKAAMYIGGSWDIGIINEKTTSNISWFPPPVEKKGDKLSYCFHADAGIGVNKHSKHLKEAMDFIRWTTTPEFAQLFMEEIPGFFAYTPGHYKLSNPLAKKMMDASQHADLTIRTTWEKLSDESPTGNMLINNALIGMLNDQLTPEQAAAYVQKGLESWYRP